ncbi:MAG: hypothetical protein WD690_11150 [Vicinamibacterales bacterium]
MTEQDILQALDRAVRRSLGRDEIQNAIREMGRRLASDADLRIAWQALPLGIYDDLPAGVRSSWVFALRAGLTTGAERHPNSHQRVMSVIGSADLQIWDGTRWQPHRLTSREDGALADRWLSIPPHTWHRPVIDPLEDWYVVSFHTAEADELIEERARDDEHPDAGASRAELYAGRLAR